MLINNTGNVNIFVNFSSNVNGSQLLTGQTGADVSDFLFSVRNGTPTATGDGSQAGCYNISVGPYTWYPVNNSVGGTRASLICQNLTYTSTNYTFTIEYNVTIEPDLPTGSKTATITISCGQS